MRGRAAEPGMADQADLPSHQPFGPKRRRLAPLYVAICSSRRRSHGSVPAWRTLPVVVVVVVVVVVATVVVSITLADVLAAW